MSLQSLYLKKNEDKRIKAGHLWIYSNEIDIAKTPLKEFTPGEEVLVLASDQKPLGIAYINPHSLIAARLLTRNPHEKRDVTFFIKRIQRALDLRTHLFPKPFYRLVFGESDGLPGLIADRFDSILVLQLNTAGMDAHSSLIIEAFQSVLPQLHSILLRNDSRERKQEGLEQYIKPALGLPPETLSLEENETFFSAPLWKGQKTGWFYDHRQNRLFLKEKVLGKRVLDVFSYLGAWGIEAAHWGASQVICVDAAQQTTEWIRKNAALNQVSEKVSIVIDDAFDALKQLAEDNEKFDVIILDPPAFVKKSKDKKAGLLAYQRINTLALKLLNDNGFLISCSCSMHVSFEEFMQVLRRAALQSRGELQLIQRGHQASDHPVHFAIPETDYLKMVVSRYIQRS